MSEPMDENSMDVREEPLVDIFEIQNDQNQDSAQSGSSSLADAIELSNAAMQTQMEANKVRMPAVSNTG